MSSSFSFSASALTSNVTKLQSCLNVKQDLSLQLEKQNEKQEQEEEEKEEKEEKEEEDYMSLKFLDPLPNSSSSTSSSVIKSKRKLSPTSSSSITKAHLNKKLDLTNKGMQLLLKLGYQEGSSLGANPTQGLIEPLPIQIHLGRKGIGMKTKEEVSLKQELVKSNLFQEHQQTYRTWSGSQYTLKSIQKDIEKCRRMCYQLDQTSGSPSFLHFWPLSTQPNSEQCNFEHSPSLSRSTTPIEIIKEDDPFNRDMNGFEHEIKTKKLEKQGMFTTQEQENTALTQASLEFEALEPLTQLNQLLSYLRTTYFYCPYCGCSFTSIHELNEQCPGPSKEDHVDL